MFGQYDGFVIVIFPIPEQRPRPAWRWAVARPSSIWSPRTHRGREPQL